jgi:hypothetical protein
LTAVEIIPFEFIDNSLVDRGARKKIRSHVMKDKNVGKTQPEGKKASIIEEKTGMPYWETKFGVDV